MSDQQFVAFVLLGFVALFILAITNALGRLVTKIRAWLERRSYRRGIALEMWGDFAGALERYRTFQSYSAYYRRARIREGIVYYKAHKYEKAIKILSELSKDNPDDDQLVYFHGMSLIRKEKILEGRGILNTLLIKHPTDKELVNLINKLDEELNLRLKNYADRINQSLRNQAWDQALQLTFTAHSYDINNSLDVKQNVPYLRNKVALSLIDGGKRTEAIEIWSRALRDCPPNLLVLHNIALAHWFDFKAFLSTAPNPLELKKKWSTVEDHLTITFVNPVFWEWMIIEKKWLKEEDRTIENLAQNVAKELSNRMKNEVVEIIGQEHSDARKILLAAWVECQRQWELKQRALSYAATIFARSLKQGEGSAADLMAVLEAISNALKEPQKVDLGAAFGLQSWSGDLGLVQCKIGLDVRFDKAIVDLSEDKVLQASNLMKEVVGLKVASADSFPRFSREAILQIKRLFESGKSNEALEIADLIVKLGYHKEDLKYFSSLYTRAAMDMVGDNLRRATRCMEKAVLYDLSSERARKSLSVCYARLARAKEDQADHLSTAKFLELSMLCDPSDPENRKLAEWLALTYNNIGVELSNRNNSAAAIQYYRKSLMYRPEDVCFDNLRRVGGVISSEELAHSGIAVDPSKIINNCSFSAKVFQKWVQDVFRRGRWLLDAGKFQSFSLDGEIGEIDFVPQEMFLPHSLSCQAMVSLVHRYYTMIKRGQCDKVPISGRVGFNPELISREDSESHGMFRNEVIRIYHDTEWELFTTL